MIKLGQPLNIKMRNQLARTKSRLDISNETYQPDRLDFDELLIGTWDIEETMGWGIGYQDHEL